MRDSRSEHERQSLNARLLRFRSEPQSEDACDLAEALLAQGRFADARGVARSAQPADREDGGLLLLEGRGFLGERDLVRAQALFQRAVRAEPELHQAYHYLGEVLLKRGDPHRASKALARALSLNPGDAATAKLAARAEYLAEAVGEQTELPSLDAPSQPSEPSARRAAATSAAMGGGPGREPGAPHHAGAGKAPAVQRAPFASGAANSQAAAGSPSPAQARGSRPEAYMAKPSDETRRVRPRRAEEAAFDHELEAELSHAFAEPEASPPRGRGGDAKPAEAARHALPNLGAAHVHNKLQREIAGSNGARMSHPEPSAPRSPLKPESPAPSRVVTAPLRKTHMGGAQPTTGGTPRFMPGKSPAPPSVLGKARSQSPHPPGSPRPTREPAETYPAGETDAEEPYSGPGFARAAARSLQDESNPLAARGSQGRAPGFSAQSESAASDPFGSGRPSEAPTASTPNLLSRTASMRAPAQAGRRPSVPAPGPVQAQLTKTASMRAAGHSRPPSGPASNPARPALSRSTPDPARPALSRSTPDPARPALSRSTPGQSQPSAAPASNPARPALSRTASMRATGRADGKSQPPSNGVHNPLSRTASMRAPGLGERPRTNAAPSSIVVDPALMEPDTGAAQAPVLGADAHLPADAEQAFSVVQSLGLFEQPGAPNAGDAWLERSQVPHQGQRLRNTLIAVWAGVLLASGGGYYAFRRHIEQRHSEASRLVAEAGALAQRGDHEQLIAAEQLLRGARELHPASQDVPREALLLQLQRVLDDGERDTLAFEGALSRARAAQVTSPALSLGQAVASAWAGDRARRDSAFEETLAAATTDPRALYLLGRAEQRSGPARPEALGHIQAAARLAPKLVPAHLALAEAAYAAGDRRAAQQALEQALAADPKHLRARVLRLFVAADDLEPRALASELDGLAAPLAKAGAVDRALAALVRARVARRTGDAAAASGAIAEAGRAGAEAPAVLSWVAREALAIGDLAAAQTVATQAVAALPEVAQNRLLLARILIARHDGEHALALLDTFAVSDSQALLLRAEAALLSNDPEAMKRALAALTDPGANSAALGTRGSALRVRLDAKLAPGSSNLARARALVKSAPADPSALLALAEAALGARESGAAQSALKQLLALTPKDADAHTLLGRAQRMAGNAALAEASFRRALELAKGHLDASIALAALLLDQGQFEAADALYQELAQQPAHALTGRLGRAEALLGREQLADAQVQLDAVPEAQRAAPSYLELSARVALAKGEPAAALRALRPLVDGQDATPRVLALYGDILRAAQQPTAAAKAYASALSADSDLPEALLGSAELQLSPAKVKVVLDLLDRAQAALRSRIRPPAVTARQLTLLGRAKLLRHKRGDAEAASVALAAAAKLPYAPHEAYYFLAEALGGKGAEARAAYERYLELEPHGVYRERARRASSAAQ